MCIYNNNNIPISLLQFRALTSVAVDHDVSLIIVLYITKRSQVYKFKVEVERAPEKNRPLVHFYFDSLSFNDAPSSATFCKVLT